MKSKEKIEFIANKYIEEIEKGIFGKSGDYFITTRELARKSEISLEYANKVMNIIVENKTIMLIGKHYYIKKCFYFRFGKRNCKCGRKFWIFAYYTNFR